MFYDDYGGQNGYRRALGLTSKECRLIQCLNDSPLTFKQIAGILSDVWHPFPLRRKGTLMKLTVGG